MNRKLWISTAIVALLGVSVFLWTAYVKDSQPKVVLKHEESTASHQDDVDDRTRCIGVWEDYVVLIEKESVVCEYVNGSVIMRVEAIRMEPLRSTLDDNTQKPLYYDDVLSFFSAGDHYYLSKGGDLSSRLQGGLDDDYFVYNRRMLIGFDNAIATKNQLELKSKYKPVRLIRGAVMYSEFQDGLKAWLISRHSPVYHGPRLEAVGCNQDGDCAMTVETELVFKTKDDIIASYCILRGSAPVKWSMPKNPLNPNIYPQVDPDLQVNTEILRKHTAKLERLYGNPVVILNLLEGKKREVGLKEMIGNAAELANVKLIEFPMHTIVHQHGNKWGEHLAGAFNYKEHGFYLKDLKGDIKRKQSGIIRVNCLSVLDRTSGAQALLTRLLLPEMLHSIDSTSQLTKINDWLRMAWATTADTISWQVGGSMAEQTALILYDDYSYAGIIYNKLQSLVRHVMSNWSHDRLYAVMKAIL